MQLRESNNNQENLPTLSNQIKINNKCDQEFLKPIAIKFQAKVNKNIQTALKHKFHQEYKASIKGINTQFDLDFMVENCIGSGSTGASFKACSTKQRGKQFALKFLMEKKAKDLKSHHKRAKNEIKIQYNLKSPYITQIFGYYTLNNDYCIVQDYEQLGDLNSFQKNVLKGGNFNENLLLLLSNNILKGLKHLYEMKICHFDIKKDNILVDEFFNFKLSDFSVSDSYFGLKSVFLKNIGTGCYISPENFNKCEISAEDVIKVDLWSFGILLYKLANNERFPFSLSGKEQSLEEIQLKINNNYLNIDDLNVSEDLKDLIFNLLKKNIKERISFEKVLSHPWMVKSNELTETKNKYGDNLKFMIDVLYNKVF